MWIRREIGKVLEDLAGKRPVVLITGARQTGKTSLATHTFPKVPLVSLDLPRLAEEAEMSGEQFLHRLGSPLIIDEVQYAPSLFRFLKHAVDSEPKQKGKYILTGSQKFQLMQGVRESLAGRISILELHSLSLKELEESEGKVAEGDQLLAWMHQGGYPELHAEKLDPERFFSDYTATYLERDVRQVLQVRDLRDFDRFLRLTALRTSQTLSLHSLASDTGVSPNTVKSWLAVLEASGVIYLLQPYYENLGKRLVKTPKLYFLDTGLACFLAGIRTFKDLRQSTMLGPMFETLVLGQIIRWFANRGSQPSLYFYRDHTGMEIDFVVPSGRRLKLYECKWAESPGVISAFDKIKDLIGRRRIASCGIISPVRNTRRTKDGVLIENPVDLDSLM